MGNAAVAGHCHRASVCVGLGSAADGDKDAAAYLPIFLNGKRVLVQVGMDRYRADDSEIKAARPLMSGWREQMSSSGRMYYWHVKTRECTFVRPAQQADTFGIAYRRDKHLDDMGGGDHKLLLAWGEEVSGRDEGDGWLVCGAPDGFVSSSPEEFPKAPADHRGFNFGGHSTSDWAHHWAEHLKSQSENAPEGSPRKRQSQRGYWTPRKSTTSTTASSDDEWSTTASSDACDWQREQSVSPSKVRGVSSCDGCAHVGEANAPNASLIEQCNELQSLAARGRQVDLDGNGAAELLPVIEKVRSSALESEQRVTHLESQNSELAKQLSTLALRIEKLEGVQSRPQTTTPRPSPRERDAPDGAVVKVVTDVKKPAVDRRSAYFIPSKSELARGLGELKACPEEAPMVDTMEPTELSRILERRKSKSEIAASKSGPVKLNLARVSRPSDAPMSAHF